jgi:uncharacterized protein
MIRFSIVIILGMMLVSMTWQTLAQPADGEFTGTIRIGGRYVESQGVELRFFPSKKVILETGFREGLIIERTIAGTDNFVEIARLNPFADAQWDEAMAAQPSDSETLDLLDLAREFLKSAQTPKGGNFDFEQGINALKQQKADEDFEYAIFVLSAVRDPKVAEALALSYFDKSVLPQNTYTYRVKTVGTPPIYTVVPEPFTIETTNITTQFENDVFVYEGDTELNFAWKESDYLSGYLVERMGPNENTFSPLNTTPIYNLTGGEYEGEKRGSYRDENLINYQQYTYRFYGSNLFGEKVLFAEVKAMPRDRTPPEQPFLEKPEHVAPNQVLLKWQMNPVPAPDLLGFVIGRSDATDGDYEVLHGNLLPKESRSFTDSTFRTGGLNYYVVQAIDTALNVSSSFPVAVTLIDTIPPAKPVFISGSIDSTGVVTLEVAKNSERDLMGYRLFKANNPAHEFSMIYEHFVDSDTLNHTIQLVFTDTVTLNSLTPFIYYSIKALDFNYNQSGFSEIMIIERPDTIPPTTPVFKRVVSSKTNVELHFALSESSDLASHEIYRKTNMEQPWNLLAFLEPDQTVYVDSDVVLETTYYYSLRAVDQSGLYSDYAHPMFGKAYDDGVRMAVEAFALTIVDNAAVLSWRYADFKEGTYFVIYKTDNQGRFRQHARTTQFSFSDQLKTAISVRYALKVFTPDGGQSPMSNEVVYEN